MTTTDEGPRQIPVGVDLGGVVVEAWQWLPGAAAAVAALETARGVHVVSKCGPAMERRSRAWLEEVDFAGLTGIGPDRWHFVRRREDKGPVAARLGLGAFVDNRQEVLDAMPPTVERVLFVGWPAALYRLLSDVARSQGVPS